jgi:hypothetical protein
MRLWDYALGFGKYTVYKNDPKTGQPAHKIEDKVFVIRLHDPAAPATLAAYADAVQGHDPELAQDVRNLAAEAEARGEHHWPND